MSKYSKKHLIRSIISGEKLQGINPTAPPAPRENESNQKTQPSEKNINSNNGTKRGERRGQTKPRW